MDLLAEYSTKYLGKELPSLPSSLSEAKEMITMRMLQQMLGQQPQGQQGLQELMQWAFLTKLTEERKVEPPKETALDKILALGMVRSLFRPEEPAVRVAAERGEWEKVRELVEEQNKETRTLIQELLLGRKIEGIEAGMKEKLSDLSGRFSRIEGILEDAKKTEGGTKHIAGVLGEYNTLKNEIVKFAEGIGMTKEEYTKGERVNWYRIFDRMLRVAEEAAKRYPQQPPATPPEVVPIAETPPLPSSTGAEEST